MGRADDLSPLRLRRRVLLKAKVRIPKGGSVAVNKKGSSLRLLLRRMPRMRVGKRSAMVASSATKSVPTLEGAATLEESAREASVSEI